MAKSTKSDRVKLALRRLVEDEEVQEQLRNAVIRLREAQSLAVRRPGSKAVQDKKLYDKIREAATSLTEVAGRLRRQPEPPKRRGRKAALVAVTAGGAAYALKRRGSSSNAPAEVTLSAPAS